MVLDSAVLPMSIKQCLVTGLTTQAHLHCLWPHQPHPETMDNSWTLPKEGEFLVSKEALYVTDHVEVHLNVLNSYHDHRLTGQPSTGKTVRDIRRHLYWPRLVQVATYYVWSCSTCLQSKPVHYKPFSPLQCLPVAIRPWDSISLVFSLLPLAELAYNNTQHSAASVTLFFAIKEFHLKLEVFQESAPLESAHEMATDMKDLHQYLHDHQHLGPFPIMEVVASCATRLRLPLALHSIPSRSDDLPPPLEVNNSVEYGVHHIMDSRIDCRRKGLSILYLIECSGYNDMAGATHRDQKRMSGMPPT